MFLQCRKSCNIYVQYKATIVTYTIFDKDPQIESEDIVHGYCTTKASNTVL